jgi:hypothetical protein
MIELFVGMMLESGRENKSPGGGKRKNATAGRGTARTKGNEPVILPLDHDGYTEEIFDDEME